MKEFNYVVKQKVNRVVEQVADLSVLADTSEEADRLAAQKLFETRYSLDWFDSETLSDDFEGLPEILSVG